MDEHEHLPLLSMGSADNYVLTLPPDIWENAETDIDRRYFAVYLWILGVRHRLIAIQTLWRRDPHSPDLSLAPHLIQAAADPSTFGIYEALKDVYDIEQFATITIDRLTYAVFLRPTEYIYDSTQTAIIDE